LTMSKIQELLDAEAELSNKGAGKGDPVRSAILIEIRELRGTDAPVCFGHDDCSTLILSMCPWRNDCGT
jgi:hypothetical protein